MLAEIITIGDELLIGQTIDTNGSWIGEKLNSIGLQVSHITSIQDKREQILNALKLASERSILIIVTGGLGPTNDDITKHTLCEYFESDLTLNTDILKKIEDYFGDGKKFGVKIEYAISNKPLATAGQLKTAEKFIEHPFRKRSLIFTPTRTRRTKNTRLQILYHLKMSLLLRFVLLLHHVYLILQSQLMIESKLPNFFLFNTILQ